MANNSLSRIDPAKVSESIATIMSEENQTLGKSIREALRGELLAGQKWLEQRITETLYPGLGMPATFAKGNGQGPGNFEHATLTISGGVAQIKPGDKLRIGSEGIFEVVAVNYSNNEIQVQGMYLPAFPVENVKIELELETESWEGIERSIDPNRFFSGPVKVEEPKKPKRSNLVRPDGEWKITRH